MSEPSLSQSTQDHVPADADDRDSLSSAEGAPPASGAETETPAPPLVAREPAVISAGAAASDRLCFYEEIARGGMGAILRGHDADLHRDIAVKVLLPEHQDKSALLQRFVEEARIAGQLQHPGVVPIYELGQLPDRRPYFTMKLVKGGTLAALLQERASPTDNLPHLLGIFEQVCQTMAYAHARGVLHRDLKPSNIMVGGFGEVQVMDWGLAKVIANAEANRADAFSEPVSIIHTGRSAQADNPDSDANTRAGSVLGTPAYMAPEQARGEVERVDERADVFGLGAILCQILTGRPPFAGDTSEAQSLARAARLDFAWARLDKCGADTELIALAERCLAAEPEDRPRHAGEVATAMTTYLESVQHRLRRAELERAQAQVKASEERKRRKLALALAAAVCCLALLGTGGGLWLQHLRAERRAEAARQESELRQEIVSALGTVTDLQKRGRWSEARAVLEQTRQRLGETGPDDLRDRVERANADLSLVGQLDEARLRSRTTGASFDWKASDSQYETAFHEAGLGGPGDDIDAAAQRIRMSPIREQLIAALDDWARISSKEDRLNWILAMARRADPHPWRDRLRQPATWRDRAAVEQLAREARVAEMSPQFVMTLAAVLSRNGGDAVPLLKEAQRAYVNDFWINCSLGFLLQQAEKWEEALGYYRAALAVRPKASALYTNLGGVLIQQERYEEGLAACEQALALNPRETIGQVHRALAFQRLGRTDEAIAICRELLKSDRNLPGAYRVLGDALAGKGRIDEAIAAYRELVAVDPKDPKAQCNMGNLFLRQGRLDEAIAAHRRAVALQPNSAALSINLVEALRRKGNLDEAIALGTKAVALDPHLAMAHSNLGVALQNKNRLSEAYAAYLRAVLLDPKSAIHHSNLGALLVVVGQIDEGLRELQQALTLNDKDGVTHGALGNALFLQGRYSEAYPAQRRSLELLPKGHPLRALVADQLAKSEVLSKREKKLPAIMTGDAQPGDDAERLFYADLCQKRNLPVAAARLYRDAFAETLPLAVRRNAISCAALSAAGQIGDAAKLDDKERIVWRKQALAWLRAEVALLAKQTDRKAAERLLRGWQEDPYLAGLRDLAAVNKLPRDEREACLKVWDEIETLLQKGRAATK